MALSTASSGPTGTQVGLGRDVVVTGGTTTLWSRGIASSWETTSAGRS